VAFRAPDCSISEKICGGLDINARIGFHPLCRGDQWVANPQFLNPAAAFCKL
jgi:hypothetical protein